MGPMPEPATLLARLRDDLGRRRIRQGIGTLERMRSALEAIEPGPGAGVLVGLVAQWVDAGFDGRAFLESVLARFPAPIRPTLPLVDFLHLTMAEAAAAMAREDYAGAAVRLERVLVFEGDVDDAELFAIANFWLGRSLRKRGRYDQAQERTAHGERLALACGYTEMAAIMQVTLSWLAFQRGTLHEATHILRRAEEALRPTDDFTSRGNIQSAYGRIARRQGKYEAAHERFERAIADFREGGGSPLPLARTLVNLAFVQRLLAEREQKESDRDAASRRGQGETAGEDARGRRAGIEHMREAARRALAEAGAIYTRQGSHRGMAAVRITEGFLRLDAGDIEGAAADADEAFRQGAAVSDAFVMARARTLACAVANAAVEEEVGDPAQHHEAAERFAREAVEHAGRTENRRLLARALVWHGLTFTMEPADLSAARRCCEQALALLQPEGVERQYIWDDLEMLKSRVLDAQPVESTLRAWSSGIVGGQTFQQMTEEFARIVIPRVWEREGRKVSRVAGKLSISPKKVRRILHAAGVTARGRE